MEACGVASVSSSGVPTSGVSLGRYSILLSGLSLARATEYLTRLKDGEVPGDRLRDALGRLQAGSGLGGLDAIGLVQLLIDARGVNDCVFAEIGEEWTAVELSILGDISIAVNVSIFDDGAYDRPNAFCMSFPGTIVFACGTRLDRGDASADWAELVPDGTQLDERAFFQLHERRLVPCLQHCHDVAASRGRYALITVPALSCDEAAGPWRGCLGALLGDVLERILELYGSEWPGIKVVYYDAFNEGRCDRTKIHGIDFISQPLEQNGDNPRFQLSPPQAYEGVAGGADDDFASCDFFSVATWGHASWCHMAFWTGERSSDASAKAAATDCMYALTGVKGSYDAQTARYVPPEGYKDWSDVVDQHGLTLDTSTLRELQPVMQTVAHDPLALSPSMENALSRTLSNMKAGYRICVLGVVAPECVEAVESARLVAQGLSTSLGSRAVFITTGHAGVQQTFAESCADGERVYSILPDGVASNYATGVDLNVADSEEQARALLTAVGDIYLSFEGDKAVAEEAEVAFARGARVLPLIRTGGASAGAFGFPAEAIADPDFFVKEGQWAMLSRTDVSLSLTAAAVVSIVVDMLDASESLSPEPALGSVVEEADVSVPSSHYDLSSFFKQEADGFQESQARLRNSAVGADESSSLIAQLQERRSKAVRKECQLAVLAQAQQDHRLHIECLQEKGQGHKEDWIDRATKLEMEQRQAQNDQREKNELLAEIASLQARSEAIRGQSYALQNQLDIALKEAATANTLQSRLDAALEDAATAKAQADTYSAQADALRHQLGVTSQEAAAAKARATELEAVVQEMPQGSNVTVTPVGETHENAPQSQEEYAAVVVDHGKLVQALAQLQGKYDLLLKNYDAVNKSHSVLVSYCERLDIDDVEVAKLRQEQQASMMAKMVALIDDRSPREAQDALRQSQEVLDLRLEVARLQSELESSQRRREDDQNTLRLELDAVRAKQLAQATATGEVSAFRAMQAKLGGQESSLQNMRQQYARALLQTGELQMENSQLKQELAEVTCLIQSAQSTRSPCNPPVVVCHPETNDNVVPVSPICSTGFFQVVSNNEITMPATPVPPTPNVSIGAPWQGGVAGQVLSSNAGVGVSVPVLPQVATSSYAPTQAVQIPTAPLVANIYVTTTPFGENQASIVVSPRTLQSRHVASPQRCLSSQLSTSYIEAPVCVQARSVSPMAPVAQAVCGDGGQPSVVLLPAGALTRGSKLGTRFVQATPQMAQLGVAVASIASLSDPAGPSRVSGLGAQVSSAASLSFCNGPQPNPIGATT